MFMIVVPVIFLERSEFLPVVRGRKTNQMGVALTLVETLVIGFSYGNLKALDTKFVASTKRPTNEPLNIVLDPPASIVP